MVGGREGKRGLSGGQQTKPSCTEVCAGKTGHAEGGGVAFDDAQITLAQLDDVFLGTHDPTQLNRQGNDVGTQYRSGIYVTSPAQRKLAEDAKAMYEAELAKQGYGGITTEILDAPAFYFAEDYHQQYLAKNPAGYCGLGGTGVSCPIGTGVSAA
mgnify:CR=1 FL=1